MRNLIIRLCQWIISKLSLMDDWKTIIPPGIDGITRVITKSGQVWESKDTFTSHADGKWHRVFIILILVSMGFVGCSTHKHCGTAHYSELTSQDFENMKQRMEVNEFLLRQ